MRKFKFLSMLLAMVMLVSVFSSTAFAATSKTEESDLAVSVVSSAVISDTLSVLSAMTEGRAFTVNSVETLYSLSGNVEYALVTFSGGGYAIIDVASGCLVEALPDGINPYANVSGDKYYAGPLNHIYMDSTDNLRSVKENSVLTATEIQEKTTAITEARNQQEIAKAEGSGSKANPASATVTYSSYIINTMAFGNNVNGTCGSVAAGMMLTYLDNKVYGVGKIVPLSMAYGETLHQSLIPYCESTLLGGSTSGTVSSGINSWLTANASNSYKVPKIVSASYTYVGGRGKAETSIAGGKPCVVSLGAILGSTYGDHQVLAFGYYSNSNGKYYNAHVGWSGSGYSNAIINSAWSPGVCWVS